MGGLPPPLPWSLLALLGAFVRGIEAAPTTLLLAIATTSQASPFHPHSLAAREHTPTRRAAHHPHHNLSASTISGITVGLALLVFISVAVVLYGLRRVRRTERTREAKLEAEAAAGSSSRVMTVCLPPAGSGEEDGGTAWREEKGKQVETTRPVELQDFQDQLEKADDGREEGRGDGEKGTASGAVSASCMAGHSVGA